MLKQQALPEKKQKTLQNANCVVMVPPKEFAFNAETAKDNEFQHKVNDTTEHIRELAMQEFNTMVDQLRHAGVQVVVFDYPLGDVETPDAVFPNNWFSTTVDGELFTFPMACRCRCGKTRLTRTGLGFRTAATASSHSPSAPMCSNRCATT